MIVGLTPKQVQSKRNVSDSLQFRFLNFPRPSLGRLHVPPFVVLDEGFDGVRPQSAI